MKLNSFLNGYLNTNGYTFPMGSYIPNGFIDLGTWERDNKTGLQQLIKTRNNLYIFIQSTSRVYKAVHRDSLKIDFIRIDSTLSMGYNIGSYQFSVGEVIYSYGGYGFWKNNGLLRKFNFTQNEWDIVPLNEEVIAQIFPVQLVWYNNQLKRLIVPLQQLRNEGILNFNHDFGPVEEKSWELDLEKMHWTNLGKASESVIKFAKDASFRACYSSTEGVLYVSYGLFYWFDYGTNEFSKSADLGLIQRIDRNERAASFSYMRGKNIFYWDALKNTTDTVSLPIERFDRMDSISKKGPGLSFLFITAVIILTTVLLFVIRFRKRINHPNDKLVRNKKVKPTYSDSTTGEVQAVNIFSVFNPTELELIKMFLELSSSGVFADIEQINHVLGIKNKNMGMQKKVRSDVMNSVNEKFKMAFGTDSVLITSIRKKEDKRFFDYYMVESNRHLVEKYLSQSQK